MAHLFLKMFCSGHSFCLHQRCISWWRSCGVSNHVYLVTINVVIWWCSFWMRPNRSDIIFCHACEIILHLISEFIWTEAIKQFIILMKIEGFPPIFCYKTCNFCLSSQRTRLIQTSSFCNLVLHSLFVNTSFFLMFFLHFPCIFFRRDTWKIQKKTESRDW